MGEVDAGEAKQYQDEEKEESDEAVSGDSLFVSERAETMDRARGQILDHSGIVRVGALEVDADPAPDGCEVKLAETLRVDSAVGFRMGRTERGEGDRRWGKGLGPARRRWCGSGSGRSRRGLSLGSGRRLAELIDLSLQLADLVRKFPGTGFERVV